MEIFLGFVFGCVASMLATLILNAIPAYRQRPILSLLRNPVLFLQLHRNTEQRRIKALIDSLFKAWEEKDLKKYMACWASDAVRVVGPANTIVDHLPDIEEGFKKSANRYSAIRVLSAHIEDIKIRETTPDEAVVEARYRFHLTRAADLLPLYEEATEFYVLRRTKHEGWRIASNLDHSKDVVKA